MTKQNEISGTLWSETWKDNLHENFTFSNYERFGDDKKKVPQKIVSKWQKITSLIKEKELSCSSSAPASGLKDFSGVKINLANEKNSEMRNF